MSFTGLRNWRHLDDLLGNLDGALHLQDENTRAAVPSIEFGLYGFTPDEIESAESVQSDRPYASLMYLSMSRQYPTRRNGSSISTSLTFGVLGLDTMGKVQNEIHRVTDTLGREYKVSYVLRAQSSEIKGGEGDRGHVWGGIVLSRHI